jgi:putative transposase
MVTPAVGREAVAHLVELHEVSQRQACRVIAGARSSVRYQRTRPDDTGLRTRLRDLASERRKFGYRRLLQILKREGAAVNLKRTGRVCAEERLQVRQRKGRKRAAGTRAPMAIASHARKGNHEAETLRKTGSWLGLRSPGAKCEQALQRLLQPL